MAVATSDKQQQQYRAMQPKLTGIRESMNKCARQREFEGKIERKRERVHVEGGWGRTASKLYIAA